MSRKHLQELISNLQEFYKCPTCETSYHFDDIKLLGQIDNYCFVQLSCHHCSLPVLATVAVGEKKTKAKAKERRQSDLRPREESKFIRKGMITAGEIAGFHAFITSWSGSFNPPNK